MALVLNWQATIDEVKPTSFSPTAMKLWQRKCGELHSAHASARGMSQFEHRVDEPGVMQTA
jgi:hypothetical protein